jgi:pimeloyl-ACP methyl ester carboxylesterase
MRRMTDTHSISLRGGRTEASCAVLILHGGRERSQLPTTPWQLSYIRMLDMYACLRKASQDCAVYLLRYRMRGWNADGGEPDPVCDARWALDRIAHDHPGAPVALLGHSMGGRTAFAVADHPSVVGVCGLAPWLPANEPIARVRPDQRFVLAHGTADRMTPAPLSKQYAARLRAAGAQTARFELEGAKHAMLNEPSLWRRFAVSTTLGLVGDRPLPHGVARALSISGSGGLADALVSFGDPSSR